MIIKLAAIVIQTISFRGYELLINKKFDERPDSFSNSFYSFPEDNSRAWTPRLLFLFMTIALGASQIMFYHDYVHGVYSGGLLMLIGVAADFRRTSVANVHYFASIVGIAYCLLVPGMYYQPWFYLFFVALVFVYWAVEKGHAAKWAYSVGWVKWSETLDKHRTWWVERIAVDLAQAAEICGLIWGVENHHLFH